MENLNEMNAKIEGLSERVGEFDDAIDNDSFQLVFPLTSLKV